MVRRKSGKNSSDSDIAELEWFQESHADALDYVDQLMDENADLRRENTRLAEEVEPFQRENAGLRRANAAPQTERSTQSDHQTRNSSKCPAIFQARCSRARFLSSMLVTGSKMD